MGRRAREGRPARGGPRLALLGAAIAAALAAISPATRARAEGPSASGAPSGRATLVIVADAPTAKQAVAGLGARLPEPWRSGDDAALRRALAAQGQRTSAGVALGSPAGRAGLAKKAQAAASEAGVQAVLFVRAAPRRGGATVTLFLVAAGEPEPVLDTSVDVPGSDGGAALLSALAPALARLGRPSAAPPEARGAPPDRPAGAPARGADGTAPPAPAAVPLGGADRAIFVFSAGGGTGARVFRYHDGRSPQLRSYDLPASPNLVLAAELYPFARLKVPVLRGLGISGGFAHALGVTSRTSSGTSVSTTWLRAEGDLRLRLAFPDEDPRFILGLHGGVVLERFGFSGDPMLVPWLPDVRYVFWRAGADGRLRAGPVGILAGAAFLPAIDGGVLADRFRQTSFAAVELGGGLAIPLARVFELRATALYTRVFYAFHPVPGDLYVAGGALDHLVRAQVLATLLL